MSQTISPPVEPKSDVPAFWVEKYRKEAAKNWNKFYLRNETRFFKDRHWMDDEETDGFRTITSLKQQHCKQRYNGVTQQSGDTDGLESREQEEHVLVEVGCGVGNTVYPLLESIPNVYIHAFDFAPKAIQLVHANDKYEMLRDRLHAFVCDISQDDLKPLMVRPRKNKLEHQETAAVSSEIEYADSIILCFVLSAIYPENHLRVVQRLADVLKPGGMLMFRDYGVGDLAEHRFAKSNKIDDHFFVRQDGTLSYFFDKDYLDSLLVQSGFACEYVRLIERKVVNRKLQKEMNRSWMQAEYRKL